MLSSDGERRARERARAREGARQRGGQQERERQERPGTSAIRAPAQPHPFKLQSEPGQTTLAPSSSSARGGRCALRATLRIKHKASHSRCRLYSDCVCLSLPSQSGSPSRCRRLTATRVPRAVRKEAEPT
eukprot:1495731-Rhodomonas_salina.1